MKYHLLLPPVLLALCGCHSDLHYQEQAVESARKFIYKHARELTPEQFAFVRFTPPVLLTGPVLSRNEKNSVKRALAGGEKMQICITWRIPEQGYDYLVFGISEPRMAYWTPLKLLRRKLGKFDKMAQNALSVSRTYVMNSLYGQLSAEDFNIVRFTHPEIALTNFALPETDSEEAKEKKEQKEEKSTSQSSFVEMVSVLKTADGKNADSTSDAEKTDEKQSDEEKETANMPVPWTKVPEIKGDGKNIEQFSLLWKISGDRYVVCCGKSLRGLEKWNVLMAGVMDAAEVKSAIVEKIKTSDRFLVPDKIDSESGTGEIAPDETESQESAKGEN